MNFSAKRMRFVKAQGTMTHGARALLCWLLLAGLAFAPAVTAAESQRAAVEQRYAVVPPPSSPPAQTPAATPVAPAPRPAASVMSAEQKAKEPSPSSQEWRPAPVLPEQDPAMTFADAIRAALLEAPQFKNTQLDVEVSKLGEKDAWYKLFPKLNMTASYDKPLSSTQDGQTTKSYMNLSFNTGSYDPISAYIGYDASKLAITLAELMHLLAVQSLMEQVGTEYIKLDSQEKYILCRQEMSELTQKARTYAAQRAAQGALSTLDQRLVELKNSVAQMELRHNTNLRTQETIRLKRLLGIPDEKKVAFDTAHSLPQVVGDQASPALPSFTEVEQRNVEFKIMKVKEKLQNFNVRLSQAEHLPKFNLGLRTPDPTATRDSAAPYYMTFSASVPIWSWGETMRRTERAEMDKQKLIGANAIQTKTAKEAWTLAGMDLDLLRERVVLATTTRELRELEAQRKAISHQAGNATYESMLDAKATAIDAKMLEIKAQEEYALARLKLRVQSGVLLQEYVRVSNGNLE